MKNFTLLIAILCVAFASTSWAGKASRIPAASARLDDLSCKKKIIDWFQAGPDSMCGPGHMTTKDVTGPSVVERGYSWNAHYICESDNANYIVTTDINCDPSSFQKIELTGK